MADTERTAPAPAQAAPPPFEQWAIVELMGHVRLAGRLTEESRFGAALGRLDVPDAGGGFTTTYFGGSSVYRITPTTEAIARHIAQDSRPEPVHPWELRALAPPPEERTNRQPYGDRSTYADDDAGSYMEVELEELDDGDADADADADDRTGASDPRNKDDDRGPGFTTAEGTRYRLDDPPPA